MPATAAERLLQELGIADPAAIDLEAIAYHVGARIRYRPLDGCEARIRHPVWRESDDTAPRRIGADAWFDRREAERYEVHEQTMRMGPDEILSIVSLHDDAMLDG